MGFFDLSLRYKLPLWGGALILASVLAVSAALMLKAYEDLKEDLRTSAEGLGGILTKTLFAPLLHDDVWRAFEQVNAAFHGGRRPDHPIQPEVIFVVGPVGQIVVSTAPGELPLTADLERLGPDHALLARELDRHPPRGGLVQGMDSGGRLYFAFPIREESAQVGTLVLGYSRDVFLPRFRGLALYGILIGALVLAVLLPLNWYWGQRMARPLVDLSRRMGRVASGGQDDPPREVYPFRDELGRLFQAYDAMADELRQKALLERELLQSERLSAIGQLASGIAHEVNNPLGGMLMALDTLKARGGLPEHAARTLDMLERGLKQIQETVAALLVQARDQGRILTARDLEDVRTLIHPQALKKSLRLDWSVDLPADTRLPAAAVRQILINLLLNAVQAAPEAGWASLSLSPRDGGLDMAVVNPAEPIPPERLRHLFEPFVSGREGGSGLGLWVTYQIVGQLGGRIGARCADGLVRFDVWLPLASAEPANGQRTLPAERPRPDQPIVKEPS